MLPKVLTVKYLSFYHFWVFDHGFKFQNFPCNGCHDIMILCLNLSDLAITTVKNVDYYCNFLWH